MLKPGDKVVCVDGSPIRSNTSGAILLRLVEGAVYTVRSIHTEGHIAGYGVRLEELANPSVVWSDMTECEWSYQSERFRPIVTSKDETRVSATA